MYFLISWALPSVLLAVLIYAENKGCPQSIPTLNVVKSCPKDSTQWIKAKDRKHCHLISQNCTKLQQEFVYHCLPNKVLDSLIEVCAPTKIIVGNYCPFYDLHRNTIGPNFNQPCNEHVKKCASVYTSNSVHRYQECYEEIQEKTTADPEKRIFLEDSSRIDIETHGTFSAETMLMSRKNMSTSSNDFPWGPGEVLDSHPALTNGIYVICAILGLVLVLFAVRLYLLRPCFTGKMRCGNGNSANTEEEKSDEEKELNNMEPT